MKCSLSKTCLVSAVDEKFEFAILSIENQTAPTKHVFDNEHFMDWTNAKILDFKLDFTKRRFIEPDFSQIPNTMNDKQDEKSLAFYSATLLQNP